MKRKRQLIGAILLAVVVSGGVYAYGALTDTISATVTVAGAEIATVDEAAAPPVWNSILTPVLDAEIFRPTAAGDETDISTQEPTSDQHWDKVDEEISDGDTTYVATDTAGWQEDLYNILDHSTLTAAGTIHYVRVYIMVSATGTPEQSSAYVHIKTNGVEYNGTEITVTTGYTTYTHQWNTNPQTGYAWTWDEIDALQIGAGLRIPRAKKADTRCTQVYARVSFSAPPLSGNVPTGNLFDITPDTNYTGDLAVKVYLTNTGALAKAYQELDMNLYLEGSVEAGQTPNYQTLTLTNGWVTFNLKDYTPGNTYTLSVTGGDYTLVSREPSEWAAGWTVTPELYCQIVQRGE